MPVNVLDLMDGPALDTVYGRLNLNDAVHRGELTLLRALKQEEGMGNLETFTNGFPAVISDEARMNSSIVVREHVARMQIENNYTIHQNG